MSLVSILTTLLKICCGGQQDQTGPSQQQGQQQQQYGGYPGQGVNQQQQAYPAQGQPSWAGVAGGGQHPQQQQHGYPPQGYQQQGQQGHQQGWQSPGHQQQQHQQQGGFNANGSAPSKPYNLPSGGVVGPHAPAGQNQDQINATNEHYVGLRNQARKAGDDAHRCFAASQQAYQAGDGGKAHELSVEGKAHQKKQDELDDQASEWIFRENNKNSPPDTIDLHGLYVKEAIERTEAAISQAQRNGREELNVIVGKGLHSQGGHAKIKPAVEQLMKKYNLSANIDPHNTGVLVVDLQGRQSGPRSRDAGGLMDQMGKEDEGCVIM
ncbi:hypothetical protein IAT38_003316 [Cryptococcus sp. DSM 104549]